MLLLSLGTSGYLILVSQPRLASYVELAREVRDVHESMLDQETGLRGWLATGDAVFLAAVHDRSRRARAGRRQLLVGRAAQPGVDRPVLTMLLARQPGRRWATRGGRRTKFTPAQRDRRHADRLPARGQGGSSTPTARRGPDAPAVIRARRTTALVRQNSRPGRHCWPATWCCSGSPRPSPCAAAAELGRHDPAPRSRDLHDTIDGLRAGDLSARAASRPASPSSTRSAPALGRPGRPSSADAGTEAAARERRLALLADRFETVVQRRPGDRRQPQRRATSRSHRDHRGGRAARRAAPRSGCAATTEEFQAAHRSPDAHGAVASRRAARPRVGRPWPRPRPRCSAASPARRAYPLVLAGHGRPACSRWHTTRHRRRHRAGARRAAVHRRRRPRVGAPAQHRPRARRPGRPDPACPTGAGSRSTWTTEWERCRRYGRPLSLVMMDLDHFKRLNDEHGHLLGDQVLREVAKAARRRAAHHRHGLPVRRRGDRRAAARDRARGGDRRRRADAARPSPRVDDRRAPAACTSPPRPAWPRRHAAMSTTPSWSRAGRQGALRGQASWAATGWSPAWTGGETLFHGEPDTIPATGLGPVR